LVEEYYGRTLDLSSGEVQERLADEFGYVTPKVGTGAAIFDADGRQLLMKRPDSGTWCFPGGFVYVTESPAEAAVREAKEETGLDVEITDFVGNYYTSPGDIHGPHGAVGIVYLCDVTGGELRLSHEGDALKYWPIEDVPEWFRNHGEVAVDARNVWKEQNR
jgi:8-oxo-dGTP pyrophosphatase MutT (NUDIX family)